MSTYSQYKNLEKPISNERYDVNVFNKNTDLIDSELHKLDLKNQIQDSLLATKESLNATNDNLKHEADRAAAAEDKLLKSLQAEISRAASTEQQLENEVNFLELGAVSIDDATIQRDLQDRLSVPALSRVFRGEIKILGSATAHMYMPLYTNESSAYRAENEQYDIGDHYEYTPDIRTGKLEITLCDKLQSKIDSGLVMDNLCTINACKLSSEGLLESESGIDVSTKDFVAGKATYPINDADLIQIRLGFSLEENDLDITAEDSPIQSCIYYVLDTSICMQEGDLFFCDVNPDAAAYSCQPSTFNVMGRDEILNSAKLYTTNYVSGNANQKAAFSTIPYISCYSSTGTVYDNRKGFTILRYKGVYQSNMIFQDLLDGYTSYSTSVSTNSSSYLATASAVYSAYRNELRNHTLATFTSIGTTGTDIALTYWAEYLLIVAAHNASTGAVYGSTARLISTPKVQTSTANVTSLALATSSNTGFSITLGNFTINIKSSSANYEVCGAVYRLK